VLFDIIIKLIVRKVLKEISMRLRIWKIKEIIVGYNNMVR